MKLIGILTLIVMIVACSSEDAGWPTSRFDAGSWLKAQEADRYVFAHDIIDRKLLLGKSEAEVRELLGPPSSVVAAGKHLAYVIKIGGSGFSQVYSIDVVVDPKSGLVNDVFIVSD